MSAPSAPGKRRKAVSPVVSILVIAVVVLIIGALFWYKSSQPKPVAFGDAQQLVTVQQKKRIEMMMNLDKVQQPQMREMLTKEKERLQKEGKWPPKPEDVKVNVPGQ